MLENIYLIDESKSLINAWLQAFGSIESVQVVHGGLTQVNKSPANPVRFKS